MIANRLWSALSAVAAIGLLNSPAIAGGTNLQFNGPLGNFTASPTEGAGKKGHSGSTNKAAPNANSAAEQRARAAAAARAEQRAKAAARKSNTEIETATTNAEVSPAAPIIVIPEAPTATVEPTSNATASTPPPAVADTSATTKAAGGEPGPPAEPKPMCKKYSAAVGEVIDTPCD